MELSDFDFELPDSLIAQTPAARRDASRLLVVDRAQDALHHSTFQELANWLNKGDLIVVNDSRVVPARLHGRFEDTGGRVEVLLLRRLDPTTWRALVKPARRAREGRTLKFGDDYSATVEGGEADGPIRDLRFDGRQAFDDWLEATGEIPLPPYIGRRPAAEDRDRYQTLYARPSGSVAAPTAGLHFTAGMLDRLQTCAVTLHVGYGTFKPITVSRFEEHTMDREAYEISPDAAARIEQQRRQHGRVVAVGTTTTRALEHAALADGTVHSGSAEADLFVYPGFRFQVIDALVTNFHLPRSTLLLLVSAFGGKQLIRRAYQEAIDQRYRFYSYGDAMLIV